MNVCRGKSSTRQLLTAFCVAAILQVPAIAQDAARLAENQAPTGLLVRPRLTGSLRGVTVGPGGFSLAATEVMIHSISGSIDRRLVSDQDGSFRLDDIPAGKYQISASKEGFVSAQPAVVEVAQNRVSNADIELAAAIPAPSPLPAANTKADVAPLTEREKQLLDRIDRLESRLAAMEVREGMAASATKLEKPKADVAANPAVQPPIETLRTIEVARAVSLPSALPPVGGSQPGTPVQMAQNQTAQAQTAQSGAPAVVQPAEQQPPAADLQTPFADYDWTWLNGNPRNKDVAFDTKFFTPEIRADITYTYDFNRPIDDSMGGSSELFRSNEIQLEQLGLGGDFHWENVRARFMTQFGGYSTATIRNDPSYAKGQWDLAGANRYLAEAYGGYHINVMHGVNIDAGIFMSYIGLFSYYNFDNWAYQPSYVSSNTPWFFQGIRIQTFPTHHLKLEPWIINGWQSYASANTRKGLGGQIKWTPFPWLNIVSNNYGLGHDDLYIPHRGRLHTDNSIEVKYFDKPGNGLDKMAFSFTGDLGCEFGGGVSCYTNKAGGPKQSFVGFMVYDRTWFHRDIYAFTLGGGIINNPGRYLVLIPPINGETAASAAINSPYFTGNPGDPFKAWDVSGTFDYMPRQWLTFRFEGDFRHANVPYWAGHNGLTPPPGTSNGFPTVYACMDGAPSVTPTGCGNDGGLWTPNLRKREFLIDIDLLVKF
ncbi:MAG: outer membrane beta-barrel protein [Acidobacteriia bacterium]|nr:outer membrane beta-barrel protein [Terriglobia bacterium]